MPPIAKENELLTPVPSAVSRPTTGAVSSDATPKPQPVALEVPVTVNGARSVDGSDKREPFSETTKTVLIFGNGAVIRLSSSVAPGQLLFLTNEKTKKEVVCQVVKSKNYRNVSGYVELEFTEAVVGFWGMRFPGDRLAPASSVPQTAPSVLPAKPSIPAPAAIASQPKFSDAKFAAPPAPVNAAPHTVSERAAIKPAAPVSQITTAKSTSFDPVVALNAAPVATEEPVALVLDAPSAADTQASIFAPPQAPAPLSILEGLDFSPVTDANLTASSGVKPPRPAVASNPETEELKQHTARLQEQLSSMEFSESAKPSAAKKMQTAPPAKMASKIPEFADAEPSAAPVKTAGVTKPTVLPANSSIEDEQLQIPAWLEPLARNATAPSSTQELIEREKSKRLAEQAKVDSVEELSTTIVPPIEEEQASELQAPAFSNTLSFERSASTDESAPQKSGKGLLFAAMAAGVLLAAGGAWWYTHQPSDSVAASPSAPAKPQIQTPAFSSTVSAEALKPSLSAAQPVNSQIQTIATEHAVANSQTKPAQNVPSVAPASGPTTVAHSEKAAAAPANGGGSPVTVASAQPPAAEPKKMALGDVRLATPRVKKHGGGQDEAEADAAMALSSDQPETNNDALATGLSVDTKGPAAPAAPIPIGGDVKPAKLLTSVAPAYPMLAKSQHVSGNVLIDALIDANGRVTTMKVVSGPTLLHQASMDALRQWKYQPAMLDGKPVSMHLTVTLQFRPQ